MTTMLLLPLGPSPYCLYCSYRSHSCQPGASATTSPVPACITCGGTRIEFIGADAELGPKASVQPPNSPTPCCHPTVPPMQSPTLPPTSLYSASSISTDGDRHHSRDAQEGGRKGGRPTWPGSTGGSAGAATPGAMAAATLCATAADGGEKDTFCALRRRRQPTPKAGETKGEARRDGGFLAATPCYAQPSPTCGGASGNHFLGLKPPPPPPPPSSERLPLRSRCRRERSFPSRERDRRRRSRDRGGGNKRIWNCVCDAMR